MADSKIKKLALKYPKTAGALGTATTLGNLAWWGKDILGALQHMGAFKDGGRVRGVGKAKRGFGRAMRKK